MAEILTQEARQKAEETILAYISDNKEAARAIISSATNTAVMDMLLIVHTDLSSTQIEIKYGLLCNYINMRRFYLRARNKI